MSNPWQNINLEDYENHMKLDSVMQLQSMNEMMNEQFYTYPVKTIMILGIAGGNGLNHIRPGKIEKVYGVDINENYLETCVHRYPELEGIFEPVLCDLQAENADLPEAELLVANLFIEYVGYENFQRGVTKAAPKYVSAIIQINREEGFVSDSPYLHVFDHLDEVHRKIDREGLIQAMNQIDYHHIFEIERELPNGKSLLRLDFEKQTNGL